MPTKGPTPIIIIIQVNQINLIYRIIRCHTIMLTLRSRNHCSANSRCPTSRWIVAIVAAIEHDAECYFPQIVRTLLPLICSQTRSSATAEKQRVSYACLSWPANWSCNSLNTVDVGLFVGDEWHPNLLKRLLYMLCTPWKCFSISGRNLKVRQVHRHQCSWYANRGIGEDSWFPILILLWDAKQLSNCTFKYSNSS